MGHWLEDNEKLVIIWWHWSIFRQRSDTSYDRSWPGVQRRRQVWVQTIIDTLWICFKIDLFIWKILCCEVLTNLIKTGFWKWGRAQCLEDQRDPKWWVYTLVVPSALCVYPHCQSVNRTIKQNVYLAPHFFQLHYFRWQIFEENIWSLSLSLYIWPLESWTIIAIMRFNSILRMIWGRVEC